MKSKLFGNRVLKTLERRIFGQHGSSDQERVDRADAKSSDGRISRPALFGRSRSLRRGAMVVPEHSTESLAALDLAIDLANSFTWLDDRVG